MNLSILRQKGLLLTKHLHSRCQEFNLPNVLEELDKYIQFFQTLPEECSPQDIYNHMRANGFKKLYDEPHLYETLNVRIPLEGILLKHIQDTLIVLDYYQQLEGAKKTAVYQELLSLLNNLPKSSPCLDAYVTKLDRLVRVLQTPTKDCSGNTLSLSIEPGMTDHAIAYEILNAFLKQSEQTTEEAFCAFVQQSCLLGNPLYKTLLIPSFQELLNLLSDIYQTQDFSAMVSAEK